MLLCPWAGSQGLVCWTSGYLEFQKHCFKQTPTAGTQAPSCISAAHLSSCLSGGSGITYTTGEFCSLGLPEGQGFIYFGEIMNDSTKKKKKNWQLWRKISFAKLYKYYPQSNCTFTRTIIACSLTYSRSFSYRNVYSSAGTEVKYMWHLNYTTQFLIFFLIFQNPSPWFMTFRFKPFPLSVAK